MRVMVLVKATRESEAGLMPSTDLLEAMGRFNQELIDAGVMLAGEGLRPSSEGVRVIFGGEARTIQDGPFQATSELVAGFWIWKVRDMDEALAWARRCPNTMPNGGELELRPLYEVADFGEAMTPELRQQEEQQRRTMADE